MTINYDAIRELQAYCYENAEAKGFHDDRPTDPTELAWYQGNKLLLVVSEIIEAHDEIRTGHAATETYYPTKPAPNLTGIMTAEVRRYKPEGVPSELADAVIRILDLCGEEDIDLAGMIQEKLLFNATRAYKHGKTF